MCAVCLVRTTLFPPLSLSPSPPFCFLIFFPFLKGSNNSPPFYFFLFSFFFLSFFRSSFIFFFQGGWNERGKKKEISFTKLYNRSRRVWGEILSFSVKKKRMLIHHHTLCASQVYTHLRRRLYSQNVQKGAGRDRVMPVIHFLSLVCNFNRQMTSRIGESEKSIVPFVCWVCTCVCLQYKIKQEERRKCFRGSSFVTDRTLSSPPIHSPFCGSVKKSITNTPSFSSAECTRELLKDTRTKSLFDLFKRILV